MDIIPKFETERLILKAVTLNDVPSYTKHFVDYEVIRYLSAAIPWPYPANGADHFIRNIVLPLQGKGRWVWGIFMKDNKEELIGCVDLWKEGKPENRGFWLGRKFWKKGIMTEANYPILDYAFEQLAFEKLVFANAVGNVASHKIKEKTGCRLIGTAPAKFVDDRFSEHELWELTKENWEAHKLSRNSK